jgi:hypothetical protein
MSFRRYSDVYRQCPISSQDQSLSLPLDALQAAGYAKRIQMREDMTYPHITLNSRGVPCIDATRHRVITSSPITWRMATVRRKSSSSIPT